VSYALCFNAVYHDVKFVMLSSISLSIFVVRILMLSVLLLRVLMVVVYAECLNTEYFNG
jgi:hypothetical protein